MNWEVSAELSGVDRRYRRAGDGFADTTRNRVVREDVVADPPYGALLAQDTRRRLFGSRRRANQPANEMPANPANHALQQRHGGHRRSQGTREADPNPRTIQPVPRCPAWTWRVKVPLKSIARASPSSFLARSVTW